jgi:tripeptide aminopeptidase
MVRELKEFVALPSPSFKEKIFGERIKKDLGALGLRCREDKAGQAIGGDCGNLFAALPGDKSRPTLLLCAHLDTVESGDKIVPVVKNGIMGSTGKTILGADDKASVVALLEVLRVLKEKHLPHPPLEIVFTVAEEQGLQGARRFDFSRLQADAGFVLDAAGPVGGVIVRAPGYDSLEATILGKAAHAGMQPEAGINAIQIAAKAIAKMRLGRIDAQTTANIGQISGGRAKNIVPEHCWLKGEARSHSPAALRRQTQHMLACLHQAAAEAGGALEVEIEREFEPFRAGLNSRPVRLAKAAAGKIGLPFSAGVSGGGADTAHFAAAGIPCITLAAGYDNPHSAEEQIALEELRRLGEYTLALVLAA